jgi:hypothetical protein
MSDELCAAEHHAGNKRVEGVFTTPTQQPLHLLHFEVDLYNARELLLLLLRRKIKNIRSCVAKLSRFAQG